MTNMNDILEMTFDAYIDFFNATSERDDDDLLTRDDFSAFELEHRHITPIDDDAENARAFHITIPDDCAIDILAIMTETSDDATSIPELRYFISADQMPYIPMISAK